MAAHGWKLVGIGVLLILASAVLWIALGGFQTGAYGGITNEQQATMDRANGIAAPVFVVGAVAGVVGTLALVTGAARRGRGR